MNRAANKIHAREALSRAEKRLRSGGRGSRTAWLVLGILAAAVTGSVIVWQVLERSEEADTAPEEESRTENM
ncbi:hypothetical protein ASG92_00450 [Arthrobacter sp. Soil736]|uniref:hypothetical protein n=1 Tax=Arthrobacter sp. Soil736 TaxID=1736395 RepID=UPI0006F94C99|nr:hypothetical protein [Arthrobacter sp. Soil736]KRE68391.1 hypothetical protein ASG92_00450 [Arthrobacter sp. Soil736]